METLMIAQNKLAKAGISLSIDEYDRKLLSKTGPAVFVCNQLLPGLDEWILLALLSGKYENIKVLHPYLTSPSKSLRPFIQKTPTSKTKDGLPDVNIAKKILQLVKKGGAVILPLDFSDNPLSHFGKSLMRRRILKELRKAGQPIVPIHLRADRLPGGLLRRAIPGLPYGLTLEPASISIRVGNPIMQDELMLFRKNQQWGKFIQAKIFSLGSAFDVRPELFTGLKNAVQQPLAEPLDKAEMAGEIAALDQKYLITTRGQFDVYVAPFEALGNLMFEIARLRELTFRAAGEGTGKARDMDEYDLYYLQLVIWDREAQTIVGGYRLGQGDAIFKRFGVNGFYTHSLFKTKTGFFSILKQSVELGRSYVIPEYQKHRLPLFLLWKGILYFLLANPNYRYLYGPVSISKDFSDASKGVIVEFIRRFFFDKNLAKLVAPRKPFRVKIKSVNTKLLAQSLLGEFDALETFIETIEPAHFKVPVLFRQYLKQNARFIAFNVDPNFADCLDGLMILDIKHLPASTIETLDGGR
jgi:hypothetical protein